MSDILIDRLEVNDFYDWQIKREHFYISKLIRSQNMDDIPGYLFGAAFVDVIPALGGPNKLLELNVCIMNILSVMEGRINSFWTPFNGIRRDPPSIEEFVMKLKEVLDQFPRGVFGNFGDIVFEYFNVQMSKWYATHILPDFLRDPVERWSIRWSRGKDESMVMGGMRESCHYRLPSATLANNYISKTLQRMMAFLVDVCLYLCLESFTFRMLSRGRLTLFPVYSYGPIMFNCYDGPEMCSMTPLLKTPVSSSVRATPTPTTALPTAPKRFPTLTVPPVKRKRITGPGLDDIDIPSTSSVPINPQAVTNSRQSKILPPSRSAKKKSILNDVSARSDQATPSLPPFKNTDAIRAEKPHSSTTTSISEDGNNEERHLPPPPAPPSEAEMTTSSPEKEDKSEADEYIYVDDRIEEEQANLGLVEESPHSSLDEPQLELESISTEAPSVDAEKTREQSVTTDIDRNTSLDAQLTKRDEKLERPITPSVDLHPSECDPYRPKTVVDPINIRPETSSLRFKIETASTENLIILRNEVAKELKEEPNDESPTEGAETDSLNHTIPKNEPVTSFDEPRSSSPPCFNLSLAGPSSRQSQFEVLSPASTSLSRLSNGYPDELVDEWTSSVQLIKADRKVPMIYSLWFQEMVEINRNLRASLGVQESHQIPPSYTDEIDDEYSSSLASMNGDSKLAFMYKLGLRQLVTEIRQLRIMEQASNSM